MNKKQSSQSANTSTPQDYTRHSPGINWYKNTAEQGDAFAANKLIQLKMI